MFIFWSSDCSHYTPRLSWISTLMSLKTPMMERASWHCAKRLCRWVRLEFNAPLPRFNFWQNRRNVSKAMVIQHESNLFHPIYIHVQQRVQKIDRFGMAFFLHWVVSTISYAAFFCRLGRVFSNDSRSERECRQIAREIDTRKSWWHRGIRENVPLDDERRGHPRPLHSYYIT